MLNVIEKFLELVKVPGKEGEALWIVTPLVIVTLVMLFYFQKYRDEELGWNSAVANSLVAVFVSVSLLRHIYFIDGIGGLENYIENLSRTIFSLALFMLGFILLLINFKHFLPEKIAYYISSPLTLNLISYVAIVFVYSSLHFNFETFVALILFLIFLRILLSLVQKPIRKIFSGLQRMKDKEQVTNVKKEQKKIKKEKSEIKKKEKKVIQAKKKELKKKTGLLKKIKNVVNQKEK